MVEGDKGYTIVKPELIATEPSAPRKIPKPVVLIFSRLAVWKPCLLLEGVSHVDELVGLLASSCAVSFSRKKGAWSLANPRKQSWVKDLSLFVCVAGAVHLHDQRILSGYFGAATPVGG